jgi:hypothetical protein
VDALVDILVDILVDVVVDELVVGVVLVAIAFLLLIAPVVAPIEAAKDSCLIVMEEAIATLLLGDMSADGNRKAAVLVCALRTGSLDSKRECGGVEAEAEIGDCAELGCFRLPKGEERGIVFVSEGLLPPP